MEELHYTAFISYRHLSPDQDIAIRLHTLIENYHVPDNIRKKLGIRKMGRVFRDQEELPLSKDLGADIRKALNNSDWLIVICSPRYLDSKWCNEELDYFIELGKRDHILTLLVDGEPADSFPEQLKYEMVDGERKEIEPLAGDVRADTLRESLKKLDDEKLRILAPMLDVNFDELRQRTRTRKVRIISTAVAACFMLLSGFLIYAISKNRQITRQRNLALDNQLQLLIEQSSVSAGNGNKLLALQQLTEASQIRKTAGNAHDSEMAAALEYALYNDAFEPVLTIDNNNRQFDELVFSNDDTYLLGITNLNSACLIDARTGKLLHTVSRSDIGQLDSVGFTSDDRYFYMVDSWYGFVSLYSVESGELYREYDASNGMAWNIGDKVFALKNNRLLILKEKVMVLWDYVNQTEQEILPCGDGAFESYTRPVIVDVAPDEKTVVIGSHGYGIGMKIVTLEGDVVTELQFDSQRGYPQIMFSGDGRYVAAVSGSMYFVWDASSGIQIFRGNNEEYNGGQNIMINENGSVLIVSSSDYLQAYDVAGNSLLWEKKTSSNIDTEAYLSPDGKYVSTAGGIQGVYDINNGECLYDGATTLFSHDGRKVIAGSYGSQPQVLVTPPAATASSQNSFNEELYEAERFTNPSEMIYITLKHNVSDFYRNSPGRTSRAFTSMDLRYAAQTHYDGFIEVFDISNPADTINIYCLAEHCFNDVTDVVFNGDLMASCGGYDPRCVISDLTASRIRFVLAGEEYCHGAEFSPDGSKIIMMCGYKRDRRYVYSTVTGNLLYEFRAPAGSSINMIGFTLDGCKVAAVLEDGRALTGILYPSLDEMIRQAENS